MNFVMVIRFLMGITLRIPGTRHIQDTPEGHDIAINTLGMELALKLGGSFSHWEDT